MIGPVLIAIGFALFVLVALRFVHGVKIVNGGDVDED
jgi:hypothetical protein